MKYNCSVCEQYWALLDEPYFRELKKKDDEATKDVVMFCPVCRVPEIRKERWKRGRGDER